jgi:hypothetical protein
MKRNVARRELVSARGPRVIRVLGAVVSRRVTATVVAAGEVGGDVVVGADGAEVVTVKSAPAVAAPPGVVMPILAVVAPAGTTVLIWVDESTAKMAGALPKVTPVAPPRLVPVTVTVVPGGPDDGVKARIVGAAGDGASAVTT